MSRQISAITIDRRIENGQRYGDVLDAAQDLARTYGSAAHAVAAMVRDSQLYKQWMVSSSRGMQCDGFSMNYDTTGI